jgi:iron complex transport system substrate-binding protein
VNLADVQSAVCDLTGTGTSLLSLQPYSLADVWKDIAAVGEACDVAHSAIELVTRMQDDMAAISQTALSSGRRPAVAVIEWLDPLMAAGNWIPELVAIVNAENLFGEAGLHSPFLNEEEFFRADPPVIVVGACGFDIERSLAELRCVAGRPGWQQLRALQTGEVYVCDGNQYLSRPGPRLVQSLRILAEILHPQLFAPTLERTGWVKVSRSGINGPS